MEMTEEFLVYSLCFHSIFMQRFYLKWCQIEHPVIQLDPVIPLFQNLGLLNFLCGKILFLSQNIQKILKLYAWNTNILVNILLRENAHIFPG